ncbi:MAG: hypothetical protein ACYSU5_24570 [Planctomycetota bacterium]|jgi:hypothetical protein
MYRNSILLICFVLVLSLATSVTEGADPTLVGWWKLDEGAGTVANDMSNYGNNGTLQGGPLWTVGHLVGALQFDGVQGMKVPAVKAGRAFLQRVMLIGRIAFTLSHLVPFISARLVLVRVAPRRYR